MSSGRVFSPSDASFICAGNGPVPTRERVRRCACALIYRPIPTTVSLRSQYIAAHGGRTNAYTASSDTNYYFCVGADHLPGALERFSGFFHCPLFAPSCTSRELHAVDSEHKKNLQNDSWRTFQMSKSLSRPGHVFAKFGSGNMLSLTAAAKATVNQDRPAAAAESMLGDSLAASANATPLTSRVPSPVPSFTSETEADGGSIGRETRRRLVEWWENHYCASRMNLVIIGKGNAFSFATDCHCFTHRPLRVPR